MDSHERTVTAARLADGAAFLASAIPGATTTEPVLVVDLDDVDEELAVRPAAGVAALDRLVIGRATRPVPPRLARLTAALDVTYAPLTGPTAPLTGPTAPDRTVVGVPDVDAALDAFLGAAARNPQAALIAAQVLRISETLPVPRAVEVESLAYS